MPIDCNPRIQDVPNKIPNMVPAKPAGPRIDHRLEDTAFIPDLEGLKAKVRSVVRSVDKHTGAGFIGPDFAVCRCYIQALHHNRVCVDVYGPDDALLYQFKVVYMRNCRGVEDWLLDHAINELAARRLNYMYQELKTRFRHATVQTGVTSEFIV